jgi:DNA modification methylase
MAEGSTFAQCELAWVSKDGNARLFKRLWAGLCREGDRFVEGVKRVHPTQKPVSLCEDILGEFPDAKTVLDLFGGSGSTLIACEKTGRVCRMMELSPHYCDVIVRRWQDFTGQNATLESNGKTFDEVANV